MNFDALINGLEQNDKQELISLLRDSYATTEVAKLKESYTTAENRKDFPAMLDICDRIRKLKKQ